MICKFCLHPISIETQEDMLHFFHPSFAVCGSCFQKMEPTFFRFSLAHVPCLAIYPYHAFMREKLYQLKVLRDIEIAPLFLEPYRQELHFRYRHFSCVPMPSNPQTNQARGFSPVQEIFRVLDLPFLHLLKKERDFKQATSSRKERFAHRFHIVSSGVKILPHQNLLLIDDVMTTGATLLGAIQVLSTFHPRRLEILLLSRNVGKWR